MGCNATFVVGLSCSLSSPACTGVIHASTLGCDQANHSQWSESHWTRQKCSAAPANTLPPWPSVDRPPLILCVFFFLPLSEMSMRKNLESDQISPTKGTQGREYFIWDLRCWSFKQFNLSSPDSDWCLFLASRNGGRPASSLLLSLSNMTRQAIYFSVFEAHGERL